MTVTVVGAGSWGTALAILLGRNGHDVALVGRDNDGTRSMRSCRENLRYLPGHRLPEEVSVYIEDEARPEAEMAVLAVPASAVQDSARGLGPTPVVVLASKGLEPTGTGVLSDAVGLVRPESKLAVLSGPNLAVELAKGVPTASVAASPDEETSHLVRNAFKGPNLRVYSSRDMRGVEIAGALKNVVAIGAGISDGLGFGDNTKGALVARGLNEMARLGVAMGGQIETFMGIAGVGDLFATASSRLSRNYRVGAAVGSGKSLQVAVDDLGGQIAEGVATCRIACQLARRMQVDLPIFGALELVLAGRLSPKEAVLRLMERSTPDEGVTTQR
ncbi:MAG: NAD(P)-dependent glycerol-3-phosphate dehydrogenase [Fimbriimonadaceae bacterium]|nr:NAD(P)-dependent glycerol-3-phosphate dehydrogenase [Fimbriimonadaceae bacterium]